MARSLETPSGGIARKEGRNTTDSVAGMCAGEELGLIDLTVDLKQLED